MPTIAELEARVGGLSRPSKMPGFGWSTPATKCKLGSLLRKKAGSVCSSCYAMRGHYPFPNVQTAMARRFRKLRNLPKWVKGMVAVLNARAQTKAGKHFRWHDSGDLQSHAHLKAIVEIAQKCPDVVFYLPSREVKILKGWKGEVPSNLCIRLSAQMVGQTTRIDNPHILTSSVGSGVGFPCPAKDQGNQCGDCRACWDRSVPNVDYRKH